MLGDSLEDSDGGCLLDFIFQFIPFLYTVWQEALAHLFCGSSQLGQVIDSASCVRIPFTTAFPHVRQDLKFKSGENSVINN